MSLRVVGSGDAFCGAGRGHACYWLHAPSVAPVMIDFGATALAGLGRVDLDPRALAGIAFTHLHGDHIAGWPFLWIDMLFQRVREAPLRVLGPLGIERRLRAQTRACYGDIADRTLPGGIVWEEIAPGETRTWCGLAVTAFRALHMDHPETALMLRFENPGGLAVGFSGDSAMTPVLREAAQGCALFVAECTALAPPVTGHCSWEEWRRELPGFPCRRVVLSHLGAAVRARREAILRDAPPGVELALADDGDVFSL